MRAYNRIKELEALSMDIVGNYDVHYTYDGEGRIEQEIVTGVINKTTTFSYSANDNIDTETVITDGKTITKRYVYDSVTNNITDIKVTVV